MHNIQASQTAFSRPFEPYVPDDNGAGLVILQQPRKMVKTASGGIRS